MTNESTDATRRAVLKLGAVGVAGTLAGCAGLSSSTPDVSGQTGLAQDMSAELVDRPVFLAGETSALPSPPEEAELIDAAWAVIATPDAAIQPLADGFRDGTTIAFAGSGAADALPSLLEAVAADVSYGIETVEDRPTETVVAEPRGDSAATYQFVQEGGFQDPVLEPLGWVLGGWMPDCETFVPDRWNDDRFERIGSATLAGRLPSGETYAARTNGYRNAEAGREPRYRFRTSVHAAANDGLAIDNANRVTDFADDEQLSRWFPNTHDGEDVTVDNNTDPIAERLNVSFEPASDRARAELTGCCGARIDDALTYEHQTRFRWRQSGLFDSTEHTAGGSGEASWNIPG